DPGSVQSIGSQALEVTDTLLRAPQLPEAGPNRVYADILGRVVIGHATGTGWLLLGLTAVLAGLAVWRSGAASLPGLADIGRGMLGGLWMVASGLVLIQAVRVLAGPLTRRVESADAYYTLLRRLPWMEGATILAVVAVALVLLAGREGIGRRVVAGVIAGAAVLATVLGGFDPVTLVAALVAIGLTLWSQGTARTPWGQWLGLIALIGVLALAGQALAPEAGFLFVWMALLAALAAAVTAVVDPRMERPAALIPAAIVTVIGGAWLAGLAHGVFLGIGMDFPGALIVIGLLVVLLARPLAPRGQSRALAAGAAACLILACGLSVSGRIAEPMPAPAPGGPS
ncbi:MAG: peptidase M20, partial [Alphaproteobacteria bacterium]